MHPRLKKWLTCTECGLHEFRRKVVLGRGEIPAEILFFGEAPGKSEDLLGLAFIGPAGKLLQTGIDEAIVQARRSHNPPSYYISNTLACRPTNKRFGDNRQPEALEMMACWPRVRATELVVRPRVIILLGKVAERFLVRRFPAAHCLQHPAFLLRRGGTGSTEYRTFIRQLVEAFKLPKERVLMPRTAKVRKRVPKTAKVRRIVE